MLLNRRLLEIVSLKLWNCHIKKELCYFQLHLSYDVIYCVDIIHTLPNLEKNLHNCSWWDKNLLLCTFVKHSFFCSNIHVKSVLNLIIANLTYFSVSTIVCFLHYQDMKHTQIKENHPRIIFFLVEEEAETQSLSDKNKSRENKENQCTLGEK